MTYPDENPDEGLAEVEGMPKAAAVPDMPMPRPVKENRRAQPRYIAHWRAALVGHGAKLLGRTDNVSLSGVAIVCDINVPAGREMTVYLEIPVQLGKQPVIFEAQGAVMHSALSKQGFRLGVAFRSYAGDSQNILRKALSSGTYREIFDPKYS